jgi:ABC-type polysaccharide/polyol phosphate export permease
VLQLGLFLTPVVYGLGEIPRGFRAAYVGLNPLAGVIDGLRESVLLGHAPHAAYALIAAASSCLYLLATYMLFKRLETGFADVS